MEPQPIALDTLLEKYAQPGERSIGAVRRRVAEALAAGEPDPEARARDYRAAQEAGFIPAGRIQASAGVARQTTLINCFVQPVADRIGGVGADGPGIYPALRQAAETLRRGGGVGYDFSPIRPRGAAVHSTGSEASGPVSYMRVFDASCATILSAGARRGAQMGVLRADHPDIEAFVHAKDRSGALEHFNLSVAADDAFLDAVERDAELELVHAAEPSPALQQAGAHRRGDGLWVYRRVRAQALFEDLTGRTYRYGDPGMLYLDTVNRDNNLGYAETLRATNPCAEQPLPPFGCCCLGSLDLTRFVRAPFSASARFDHGAMEAVVPIAVRMLDRVLDISYWPLPEQRLEAQHKRRVGLGFTGLGDALIMLGLRYDSEAGRATATEIARRLRDAAYRTSVALAREKGPFPLFDAAAYGRSPFVRRLPEALQEAIATHGIRNSHLLAIAPTGTISLAFADNVSTGIEPAYAWSYRRRKRTAGGWRTYRVEDHAHRRYRAERDPSGPLPEAFVSAQALRVEDHLEMMAAVAPFVDAGISKTVNVPAGYPFAEFADLYLRAWRRGLKALATFRPNPEREAVLSIDTGDDCPACD